MTGASTMTRRDLLTSLAALAALPAHAAPPGPVVLELFTSEGCSSCPPADAFLSELAHTRADVLALSFHVTYWNDLGWRDPFSLAEATARQRRYAKLLPADVYTPQLVVDGTHDVVGSNRAGVLAAIAAAAASRGAGPDLRLTPQGGQAVITVGSGSGAADIVLVGYDREHQTAVGRGENAGRTLTESNIVRSLATVGSWHAAALSIVVPLPAGDRFAVLLQASDGHILAAARGGMNPAA
jgi:hypothetical protein